MNIKIKKLHNYLSTGGNFYSLSFKEVFNENTDKKIGVDEFVHDKYFIMNFFEISGDQFDYLFDPIKGGKINSMEQFLDNLISFYNEN